MRRPYVIALIVVIGLAFVGIINAAATPRHSPAVAAKPAAAAPMPRWQRTRINRINHITDCAHLDARFTADSQNYRRYLGTPLGDVMWSYVKAASQRMDDIGC